MIHSVRIRVGIACVKPQVSTRESVERCVNEAIAAEASVGQAT